MSILYAVYATKVHKKKGEQITMVLNSEKRITCLMENFTLLACRLLQIFRQDFFIETNSMNPVQTAWEQSDLCPYCLQYMLPKNI